MERLIMPNELPHPPQAIQGPDPTPGFVPVQRFSMPLHVAYTILSKQPALLDFVRYRLAVGDPGPVWFTLADTEQGRHTYFYETEQSAREKAEQEPS